MTEHGPKLGPVDYMAPEMRQDADTAAPGPAGVWALAKTLWVLLAGQPLPLPGTHRPAEDAHALQQRIAFGFAAELDLLLERATQIDPQARATMDDVAAELRACTAEPPEARPSASLEQLSARARALTAAARQDVSDRHDRRDALDAAWRELEQIITDAGQQLARLLDFDLRTPESGYQAAGKFSRPQFSPHDGRDLGCPLLPPGQQRPAVDVVVAAALRLMREGGPADIAVTLEVHRNLDNGSTHEVNEIWARTYTAVPLASARQARALAEIRASLTSGFDNTLRAVIDILAPPQHAGSGT